MTMEVWNPRWSELLRRAFNSRAQGGPLIVLDDVMPVVPVLNPDAGEYHYQRGEAPFALAVRSALVAGQYSGAALQVQTGYIAVVESIIVSGNALACRVSVNLDLKGMVPNFAVNCIDTRVSPVTAGVYANFTANATAPTAGNKVAQVYLPANSPPVELLPWESGIVLYVRQPQPASAPLIVTTGQLSVACDTVATDLDIYISGYTRLLDVGE